jgi:hypothetical protein
MAEPEQPRINDVRLGEHGDLEFYDGTGWQPYPDVPDDDHGTPFLVARSDDDLPGER